MVSDTLYTYLQAEGDGTQRRGAIGNEPALLWVDDEQLILPREEVVARSVDTESVDTSLLRPALGSGEADREVLQT